MALERLLMIVNFKLVTVGRSVWSRVQTPGVIPIKTTGLGVKPVEKPLQKTAPNLISVCHASNN